MSSETDPPPRMPSGPWPDAWRPLERLAERDGVDVWRVARGGRQGVLRRVRAATRAELVGELEVLSTVEGRGLAGVLDHGALDRGARDDGARDDGALDDGALDDGALDDGALEVGALEVGASGVGAHSGGSGSGTVGPEPFGLTSGGLGGWFVVRDWIEGEPLDRWADGRDAEAVGALFAELLDALAELHRAGFAHGDLKPSNVLVDPDGRPVLVDFGLSRRIDGRPGRGALEGTLYALAPEQLAGGGPSPAADLFALGVALHQLVAGARRPAREFYARFPREPFLVAADPDPRALSDWAREVVEAWTRRAPERRPASAAQAARDLRARLGLPPGEPVPPPLAPAATFGREAALERLVAELDAGLEQPVAVELPSGETARPLADALRLRATLAGLATIGLDLDRALEEADGAAAVDAWAARAAREAGAAWLVCWFERDGGLVRGAADRLARARRQLRPEARTVVVGPAERTVDDATWRVVRFEPLALGALEEYLAERLDEPDAGRRARLARMYLRASGGAVARLRALFDEAARRGALLPSGERWKPRPGPLADPLEWARGRRALPEDAALARIAGLASVGGGRIARALLTEAGELDPATLAAAVHRGAAGGLWRAGTESLALVEPFELPPARARELHASRARAGLRLGAAPTATWFDRLGALADGDLEGVPGAALWDEFRARAEQRRANGAAEFVLSELERAEQVLAGRGAALPPEAVVEQALAWAELGEGVRAESALAGVERELDGAVGGGPRARATAARAALARARIARLRHDEAAALAALERAERFDPSVALEVELGRVLLDHAAGRDAEAIARVDARLAATSEVEREERWRGFCELERVRALARVRTGALPTAREELERLIDEAGAREDAAAAGGVTMNLATLERRAGDLDRAVVLFRSAAGRFAEAGRLVAGADARAQLGGALRELGRLGEAAVELDAALAVRERLGDAAGVATLQAARGLLSAERGHAARAVGELERALELLLPAQRRTIGELLVARADLQRARLGRAPLDDGAEGDTLDPRSLLDRARAAALRGDLGTARARTARAHALAERLGRAAVAAEGRLLAAALGADGAEGGSSALERIDAAAPAPEDVPPGLVRQDARLLTLLRAPATARNVDALAALARELEELGRDDRAARAWLAAAARTAEPTRKAAARAAAEDRLDRAATGADPRERSHLRRALLAAPDPRPEELDEPADGDDEEFEMEVLELLDLNRRLVEQDDLDGLLCEIVESACKVTGAERGFLVLEDQGELRLDAATDSARGGVDAGDVATSSSVVREALAQMRVLNVSNAVDDPLLGHAPSVVAQDLRSILAAPFRATEALRGVVVVDHRLRTGAFGPRAERLLGLLADQAALAVSQVSRLEQIRVLNDRLAERVTRQEHDLAEARRVLEERGIHAPGGGLVGRSRAMERLRALIGRAAPSRLSVLVRGASGTGKELVARALHELSERATGPFASENVAAIPASLIESELFGYRRGAFTGAEGDRPGLFERAHGGTLFLDEIGEMPLELQAKLLRVLETRRVRRLGDDAEREVDFRLVCATHRDLAAAIEGGTFREDLWFRLAALEIEVPPLAARAEDVPELVQHFLDLEAARSGVRRRISPAVVARLAERAWPGNVRELKNEVQRLCVLSEGDLDDPALVREARVLAAPAPELADDGRLPTLADLERRAIERALELTGDDKREAAKLLGISRAKIYQRLKEWRDDEG